MKTKDKGKALELFLRMRQFNAEAVIRTMLKDKTAADRNEATALLHALYQWLAATILLQGEEKLVMFSQNVDDAHHAFILNTRLYAQFCDEFMGKFIHHNPFDSDIAPVDEAWEAINLTMHLLPDVFGNTPEEGLSPFLSDRIQSHFSGRPLTTAEICCLSDKCSSPGVVAHSVLCPA